MLHHFRIEQSTKNTRSPNYYEKQKTDPAGIYSFKVNTVNTRTMCKICSKLRKTPKGRY